MAAPARGSVWGSRQKMDEAILDFLPRLGDANGVDELADVLEYELRDMGFSGFAYWTHVKKPVDQITGADLFLLSRGPAHLKSFETIYLSRGLYAEDPVFTNAADYRAPFTSAEARAKVETTRRRRWLYVLEDRFGFRYDLNIPVHTPLRVQVLNAYCIGKDAALGEMIERERDRLVQMATAFSAAVVDFVMVGFDDDTASVMLSRRQQEVLAWMARGRSNAEIAEILGCSERTVKFHVAGLMDKLQAVNRTEAVAIAARQGWIIN